jgi:hypothetical protein
MSTGTDRPRSQATSPGRFLLVALLGLAAPVTLTWLNFAFLTLREGYLFTLPSWYPLPIWTNSLIILGVVLGEVLIYHGYNDAVHRTLFGDERVESGSDSNSESALWADLWPHRWRILGLWVAYTMASLVLGGSLFYLLAVNFDIPLIPYL